MSIQSRRVTELVAAQQKDFAPGSFEYAVGALICDMAERDAAAAELLAQDLERSEMDIKAAGKCLREHAKKGAAGGVYAMTDEEARRLLRELYHIPEAPARKTPGTISLLDLL